MRVRITRQDDAKSPGSDGASPYLPALPVYDDVTFYENELTTRAMIHEGSHHKAG